MASFTRSLAVSSKRGQMVEKEKSVREITAELNLPKFKDAAR